MTLELAARAAPVSASSGVSTAVPSDGASLFERVPWLYAFFREHLFRDDTDLVADALWLGGAPPAAAVLLELGCGPGVYARRLAARFAGLRAVGVDRSDRQVAGARARSMAAGLDNCRFERGDARALTQPSASVDAAVAARLFTVVTDPERVVAEMYRVLRPGGRCFIAEPCDGVWAGLPLRVLWLVARVLGAPPGEGCVYREPPRATVLAADALVGLVRTRPWGHVWHWQDGQYQYVVCEKLPASQLAATG